MVPSRGTTIGFAWRTLKNLEEFNRAYNNCGLTNHHQMQELFDREKSTYEMSATGANQYGLEVSDSYPFESLDHFYGSCDDIFHAFIEVLPTLSGSMAVPWPTASDIPPRLRTMPEVVRRLD